MKTSPVSKISFNIYCLAIQKGFLPSRVGVNRRVPLPPAVEEFSWLLSSLVVIWVCVKEACRRFTSLHLTDFPYKAAFLEERFQDFVLFKSRFQYFHHAQFFADTAGPTYFMYPAPLGVIYKLFYMTPYPLTFFLAFIVSSLLTAAILFGRVLRRRGIGAAIAYAFPVCVVALSMPVWFEFIQSNMEIIIWVFVTSGIVLVFANRDCPAAICFGIAASMKVYPIAFLGLLLVQRKYWPVFIGLAAAAGTTLASLWLLGGAIWPTWVAVHDGLGRFRFLYMLQKRRELAFDHSLLSLVKFGKNPFPQPDQFAHTLSAYLAIVAVVGVALFFLRAWRLPLINQVFFLSIACILFPPVSFEYTLQHMFVPLALLVLVAIESERLGTTIPGLRPAFMCLAILLAPLSEIVVHKQGVDGQIKSVMLVALLILCLWKPFTHHQTVENARDDFR